MLEQRLAAGRRLAPRHASAREIGQDGDLSLLVGTDDQSPLAPGPFHQHHPLAGETPSHDREVPVLGLGVMDVQARGDTLAGGETRQPIMAAVEEGRQAAARLAEGPVEQGIVTAEEDVRALRHLGRGEARAVAR